MLAIAAPVSAAGQTYTVVRGDTLDSISARAHVSVTAIARINHLREANYLREGQVLLLEQPRSKPLPTITAGTARVAARTHAKHARRIAARGTRAAHAARQAAADGPARLTQRQALWTAMHTGFSIPDFSGGPSFAAAQKAIALELRLTRTALRYIGVPYMWGGESFYGVDCSGFVQVVFRRNGIELPRTADAQFEVGHRVSGARLQPGDLVFFQTYAEGASHVGIYLGYGRFVHASASHGVRVDSLSDSYYSNRFLGARRAAI